MAQFTAIEMNASMTLDEELNPRDRELLGEYPVDASQDLLFTCSPTDINSLLNAPTGGDDSEEWTDNNFEAGLISKLTLHADNEIHANAIAALNEHRAAEATTDAAYLYSDDQADAVKPDDDVLKELYASNAVDGGEWDTLNGSFTATLSIASLNKQFRQAVDISNADGGNRTVLDGFLSGDSLVSSAAQHTLTVTETTPTDSGNKAGGVERGSYEGSTTTGRIVVYIV
tara:strand:- start:868 stop:1554 length:687 start_codon:yes stop_codon:yes gene_type:complete